MKYIDLRERTRDNFLEIIAKKDIEIIRLNNIINKAIEYHDNCINNLLDLDKIDDNERLAYKVAYGIHDEYLNILKGSDKE